MEAAFLESLFEHVLHADSGRMMVITQTPFMFAAVNDSGRAALFIRISLSQSQVVSDGQGFSVKTTRSGNQDYVQITSANEGLPPLFLKLAEYVLERVSVAVSIDEGAELLIRSIEEYRRFVGQRRGRLPEALVRGTFAELVFLRTIITAGMNCENAVTAWRGPWAKAGLGVHDFTFPDGRGVEVKSTHQPPVTIRVSSPSQLMPSGQPLDLLVLPIEDALGVSDAAIPFRQYAQETREAIAVASSMALEKWDAALEALNLDLSDQWYDRYRFLPGEWRRFEVKRGFPHLDIPSLPAGIIDVQYSLELLRLTPFAVPFSELLSKVRLS